MTAEWIYYYNWIQFYLHDAEFCSEGGTGKACNPITLRKEGVAGQVKTMPPFLGSTNFGIEFGTHVDNIIR